ncbi:hypothetical protein MWU58_11190 [Flavobacteriaceae bacterium S0825]|uniref:hypothetical protein n=1 Tax=Gaetbulibacter sp. S0825 TaxID=2720084 RepID=UPI0014308A9C|nr:hypothetical protein [Gaetbulibacter sp. S0825]MCK0109860.1 hypothetical protein [Flavobacteriaceae bacterium S0825]NIX65489.1 hypothetical protein [Gaetbulibacter sp. S0825]
MKHIFKILPFFLCFISFGQSIKKEIKMLEGIWIAEEYYNSFEENNSAIKSKNAFDPNYPVALRINSKEIKKGILNIGYSVLHDHLLHPEVSEYLINNKDTIREQGKYKINLKAKDSLNYYKTTDIYYFNYDWISYFTWDINNNSVSLYRPKGNGHEEKFIVFKRIPFEFKNDYLFPNPLYYYTRSKTLSGNYTLKDNLGNILSESLTIENNGIVKGFGLLDNFTVYFSTDIYCGPPAKYDLVMFFDDILIDESEAFHYLYVKNENGNIDFHNILSNKEDGTYILGERVYELEKN